MKETISLAQKKILWRTQQQQLVPEQTHSEKTVFLIPFQSISDDFIQVFFFIFFFFNFFFMANNWLLFPVYVYFSLLIHHV